MNRLITTLFCFSLLALPAHAQERELSPGLNYTTMAKPKLPNKEEADSAEESIAEKATAEEETDPATRVWNKYKDLATGKAAEEELEKEKAEIEKPEKPEKPKVPSPSKTTMNGKPQDVPQSGLGAILNEWKNNKETRRDMRSKSFKTPKLPEKDGNEG